MPVGRVFSPSSPPRPLKPAPSVPHRPQKGLAQSFPNIQWVRDYSDEVAPHSQEGGYVNFMFSDDDNRVQANYGANYERLVEIKRRYDPDNVFHVNQNIEP